MMQGDAWGKLDFRRRLVCELQVLLLPQIFCGRGAAYFMQR